MAPIINMLSSYSPANTSAFKSSRLFTSVIIYIGMIFDRILDLQYKGIRIHTSYIFLHARPRPVVIVVLLRGQKVNSRSMKVFFILFHELIYKNMIFLPKYRCLFLARSIHIRILPFDSPFP